MTFKSQTKSASIDQINKINCEKRQLKWVPLAPPDYAIEQSYLIKSFIEKECVYIGTVLNVSCNVNIKKRSEIFKIIDESILSKKITLPGTESIVSISAQNLKLNYRMHPESLILRISLEQIISLAYVRDKIIHYIVILHSENPLEVSTCCSLSLIIVESNSQAEEICSLVTQCFQIIYTEATLRLFDQKPCKIISLLEEDDVQILNFGYEGEKAIGNQCCYIGEDDRNINESVYSDLSVSKADLLQNYMVQLQKILSPEEMRQFALALSTWQNGSPFEGFCQTINDLLGPQRIGLLADMRYFIDSVDKHTLEQFLSDVNSPMHAHWSQLLARSPLPLQAQRTLSYASTSNGVLSIYDEENSVRDDFSFQSHIDCGDTDDEFAKNMDLLFQKVGDLDLILFSGRG